MEEKLLKGLRVGSVWGRQSASWSRLSLCAAPGNTPCLILASNSRLFISGSLLNVIWALQRKLLICHQSAFSPFLLQMEETRLSASEELPQTLTVPRATALCSGHDADIADDLSPVESPRVLDLSQQPHISGFPFSSKWRSTVSPGATAPQFSSCSVSASSPGSSLQGHQEKAEPESCSLAKVSSSLELAVPQLAPSVVVPGPRLQWSPQPVSSGGDAPGLGRRRLSFQAEYWACVLPDSLPPSPDRRS